MTSVVRKSTDPKDAGLREIYEFLSQYWTPKKRSKKSLGDDEEEEGDPDDAQFCAEEDAYGLDMMAEVSDGVSDALLRKALQAHGATAAEAEKEDSSGQPSILSSGLTDDFATMQISSPSQNRMATPRKPTVSIEISDSPVPASKKPMSHCDSNGIRVARLRMLQCFGLRIVVWY